VSPEPRLDTILVVEVLARQLENFVVIDKFFETYLAIFEVDEV